MWGSHLATARELGQCQLLQAPACKDCRRETFTQALVSESLLGSVT